MDTARATAHTDIHTCLTNADMHTHRNIQASRHTHVDITRHIDMYVLEKTTCSCGQNPRHTKTTLIIIIVVASNIYRAKTEPNTILGTLHVMGVRGLSKEDTGLPVNRGIWKLEMKS